jgi:uncharacterized protein involved in exopolysaccharide biosynthesis
VAFITEQKEAAEAELQKRENALNEFFTKHPEFVQDPNNGGSEGSLIRARAKGSAVRPTQSVKERQLQRIQARLDAPPDAPPVAVPMPPTPERLAAEAAVKDAQREVASAQRALDDAMSKFTEKHPSVIKAQDQLASAQQRLRQAQAAVPAEVEAMIRPATPEDRAKLEKERAQLEKEIQDEKSRSGKVVENDNTEQRVVKLESDNSNLRRDVAEEREHVQSLAASAFRATIDASQKLAEQGGRLSVVDPAFKPVQPTGPGKTIFLMAGMILFLTLGLSLAIGLAVIDDRLYRGADLDQLGITVLGVIPPAVAQKRRRNRKRGSTTATIQRPGASP